jgi:hypothetical protein
MRPTFPGASVVAETRTLPSDVLANGRSLKPVEAGGRIGASAAPCECIPRQQHDARAVGFCRHKLRPPAAAGCGDLVQYASGQCPPSRGHDGKWITKDRATRVPRPVTARVIVMSFDLRVAVKGVAPSSRLGWQFNPVRARFGRSSVKDPNWSHPGKSTSYPRRSIPVTTMSTDPSGLYGSDLPVPWRERQGPESAQPCRSPRR